MSILYYQSEFSRFEFKGDCIVSFAVPIFLGNLFQQLYNTVDSIIVGNYIGKHALAAVGACGALIDLLLAFCIGASVGAGVVIAQQYGAREE